MPIPKFPFGLIISTSRKLKDSPKTGVRAPQGPHPCFRASLDYFVIY